jgi:hypothetical protein
MPEPIRVPDNDPVERAEAAAALMKLSGQARKGRKTRGGRRVSRRRGRKTRRSGK